VLFNQVQVPHFNYIGDSILGNYAYLGAGAIISNFRLDHKLIAVLSPEGNKIQTNREKFGAIIGDHTEIGCNSVINPGTMLEKNVTVYPLSNIGGYHKTGSVVRNQ
jgi:bifunctional N-acetylglucosamine-1-phosphate-uridyltransferase/glucosamine-1-phosphate-acetyltransferase GlmU-like protein